MTEAERYLKKTYGDEMQAVWQEQMNVLKGQVNIYFKALQDIDDNGLMLVQPNGKREKNPLLVTIKDATNQIYRILEALGLTPSSRFKIKKNQPKEEEDEAAKILSGLLNG